MPSASVIFQRPLLDALVEALALDELHHDERAPVSFADLVDRANVRVIQRSGSPCFSVETLAGFLVLQQVGGKEFERDGAA